MKALKSPLPLVVLVSFALIGGCQPRIKSVESVESAMTPNPKASGKTIDPYTYGGTAMASGGTHPQTSFASYAGTTPVVAQEAPTPAAAKPLHVGPAKPATSKPSPAKPAPKAAPAKPAKK